MGNNLYADELPYKDWIKVNNAQRCHENFYHQLPVLYSTTFITALNYPQVAFWSSAIYLGLRIMYTRAYFTDRGYNKVIALEE